MDVWAWTHPPAARATSPHAHARLIKVAAPA